MWTRGHHLPRLCVRVLLHRGHHGLVLPGSSFDEQGNQSTWDKRVDSVPLSEKYVLPTDLERAGSRRNDQWGGTPTRGDDDGGGTIKGRNETECGLVNRN